MNTRILSVLSASVAMLAIVGCGDNDSSGSSQQQTYTQRQTYTSQDATEAEPEKTQSEIVAEYNRALTSLLESRKLRENLSFSVAAKVGEEMARYRGLSQEDQKAKLEEIMKKLEDYQ